MNNMAKLSSLSGRSMNSPNPLWTDEIIMGQEQKFAMPPVNVRILHQDGTYTAVETMYSGTRDGVNHWNTVHEVVLKDGDRRVADEMPPDTEVHLYVRGAR